MDTGTIIFLIVMGFALIIHGGLWYLIAKKKEYCLLSGFANRPQEEQQYLIKNGYVKATENLLLFSWWVLFVSVLGYLLRIPYMFEMGLVVFLIVLLGGGIYVQRYEVKRKRVRSLWIMSTITAAVFVFLAVLGYFGFQENEVSVRDGKLIVEGWYGEEWAVGDIEDVRLLERLPEVIVKTNGFAAMGRLKGEFVLEKSYGSGKLFIVERSSPYVYVKHKNGAYMIVNFHTSDETKALFDTLRKEAEKRSSRLSERDLVAEAKRRWLARGNFS